MKSSQALFCIAAWSLLLFMGACGSHESRQENKVVEANPKDTPTVTGDVSIQNEGNENGNIEEKTGGIIITELEARALAAGFNKLVRPRGSTSESQATSVWFSEETIEKLYNALYKGPRNAELDGIRIYFGRYPANYGMPEKKGKLTAFILLTEFKPDAPGTTPQSSSHKDIFYFTKNMFDEKFFNFNHGELCPDSCDYVLNFREEY